MSIFMIIGLGAQGGPAASIIARDPSVEKLILADYDQDLGQMVAEKVGRGNLVVKKIDARDVSSIAKAADGVDVIINLTLPIFNQNVMQAALKAGAHYVDTSIGETLSLDLYAEDNILKRIVEAEPLPYEDAFKAQGLSCLMGCGASPGLTNVFARFLADKLDTLDELKIRFVAKPVGPEPVIQGWAPTWSPARALWGYAFQPIIFENGRYRQVPIFSGYEEYRFDDPINLAPVVYHQHPEQVTLPYYLKKDLRYCDFKYTIDRACGTLIKMGFAEDTPVEVDGLSISPRQVLLQMVAQPRARFLAESEATAAEDVTSNRQVVIELSGVRAGKTLKYRLSYNPILFDNTEEKKRLYSKFGTHLIYVALPAVVGATLCAEGKSEPGVISAECLNPIDFIKKMSDYGIDIPVRETREGALNP